MESGLQELKFSRYNQKVELSGKLFLYNALTGGYASICGKSCMKLMSVRVDLRDTGRGMNCLFGISVDVS